MSATSPNNNIKKMNNIIHKYFYTNKQSLIQVKWKRKLSAKLMHMC